MTTAAIAAGIVLCICLSAFCSSAEMAYSSCNTVRLENLRDGGSRRAAAAVRITEHFDDSLSAILMGNNLVNIAGSSLASVLVILLFGESRAWVATVVMTALVIIFGETIPKITAKKAANTLSLRYAYAVRALTIVLRPVVWLVVWLTHLITGGESPDEEPGDSEEAVEELQSIIVTAEDEDVLDEERSELVQAAIDFSEISAMEVMTARVDVWAIDIDDDWNEIVAKIETSPYSRLPVYEGSIDNVIGVLYLNHFLKTLTEEGRGTDIRKLLMQPCYVYKTMKLPAVLSLLRKAKQHLAVVTDEYGGTLGVVSMEDVLEQIVGDIWDDTDVIEQEIVERAEGEYELDGDMNIHDFLELVGIPEEGFEAESATLGGWTVEQFGAFPQVGDSFRYEGIEITVLSMDARRVEKLLVKLAAPESETEKEE